MRYYEIVRPGVLNEFGSRHGHPGYGMGIFRKGYYEYIAAHLAKIADPAVKEYLVDWFSDVFFRDTNNFKEESFRKAVDAGYIRPKVPTFQQRHFYYLAAAVRDISDSHAREFVADWLADVVGGTNPNFKRERWDKFCGVSDE